MGKVVEVDSEERGVEFPTGNYRLDRTSLYTSQFQKGTFVHLAVDDAPPEAVGEITDLADGRLKVEFMGETKDVAPMGLIKCDFQPGTCVFWTKTDDDIAPNHLGVVVPDLNDEGRVKVKFPSGFWRFDPGELVRAHVQHGSFVQWRKHDDDIAQGEVGQVQVDDYSLDNDDGRLNVKFAKGSWRFKPEELFATEVQLGSLVRWSKHDDVVPKGQVGQAVSLKVSEGRIRVQFPKGRLNFNTNELILHKIQPGSFVYWTGSDEDIPRGSIGKVIKLEESGSLHVHWPKGTWSLKTSSLKLLPFQKGDRVQWNSSNDDIPEGELGQVIDIHYHDESKTHTGFRKLLGQEEEGKEVEGGSGTRLFVKFSKGCCSMKLDELRSANLDVESMNMVKSTFKKFDKDGDGNLSVDELAAVLIGAAGGGVSEADCQKLFDALDKDGDGKLSTTEFVDYVFGCGATGSQKLLLREGFGLAATSGLNAGQDDESDDGDPEGGAGGGRGGGQVINTAPVTFRVTFNGEDAEGIDGDTVVTRGEWVSAMLAVGICRQASTEAYDARLSECQESGECEGEDLTLKDLADEINGIGGIPGIEELQTAVGRVKKGKVPTLDLSIPAAESPEERQLARQTGLDGLLFHLNVQGQPLSAGHEQLSAAKLSALEESVLGALGSDELLEALSKAQASPPTVSAMASLQRAREHCRREVQEIIARCQEKKQKYTDETWNPCDNEAECLYVDKEKPGYDCTVQKPSGWRRLSQFYLSPALFRSDGGANDIKQGGIGDCYLMGALGSIVANRPRFLRRAICCYNIKIGVYGIIFHVDSRFIYEIVDDYVAMNGYSILYGRSLDQEEVWIPVLEKAFFKHYRCCEMCDGGAGEEATYSFLGGLHGRYRIDDQLFDKPSEMFKLLSHAQQQGELLNTSFTVPSKGKYAGVSSSSSSFGQCGEQSLPFGLYEYHIYSILRVVEACGHQLICCRNPWGDGEWTGPWSDKSEEWTDRLREAFWMTDKADGTFWMAIEDFVQIAKGVTFNKTFGPTWQVVTQHGRFANDTLTARVVSEYEASEFGELSYKKLQIITVALISGQWSKGTVEGSDTLGYFRTKDVEFQQTDAFRYDLSVEGLAEGAPIHLALMLENQKRAREWTLRKGYGLNCKDTEYPDVYFLVYDSHGERVCLERLAGRHAWCSLDGSKGPWSIYISCAAGRGKRFSVQAFAPHGSMCLQKVDCTFQDIADRM
eukprot:TRINITY_DN23777_c0_g2_i1.p1 TRINITY_DN23777_c0_g2~~TRINITY_DN23777_c0_g2_i1.p1  ORF type:complete len:1282 (-),score=230.07 TRINITY_DN23777_c0_g2_i1:225-3902(-)